MQYLPDVWGGCASDKMITLNSGFLKMVSHCDYILPDCDFLMEEELAASGAVSKITVSAQGKKQLKAIDVYTS